MNPGRNSSGGSFPRKRTGIIFHSPASKSQLLLEQRQLQPSFIESGSRPGIPLYEVVADSRTRSTPNVTKSSNRMGLKLYHHVKN